MLTRCDAAERDRKSPLAGRRELFDLPADTVYLCGNSLGALPKAVPARIAEVIATEWGRDLVSSWNKADWTQLSRRVANRIGPLIGVSGDDVAVGDSTGVTLFKTMVAAARLRPERNVIVVERTTFPTDGYIAAGVARSLGLELRWCDPTDPLAAVDETVALVALSHVDFRTGAMFDLAAITAGVQAQGALMLWDLCHSAGAVQVDLTDVGADFAVGCTYKYLNGGPGSPAYAWVAPEHQDALDQPITGWWGHATPFAMERDYVPAPGVARLTVGTPPVLALSALETALEVFDGVSLSDLRAASLSLTDSFLDLVDARLPEFEVLTPRAHAVRGSQVALRHEQAFGIVRALIGRGIIGDFREPDLVRLGFAPLYVSHMDVYDAVTHLVEVMTAKEYLDPVNNSRTAVT